MGSPSFSADKMYPKKNVTPVPKITSQLHPNESIPFSERISKPRFKRALATIAKILVELPPRLVNNPRRKTPKSDPNVTPPILNASHRKFSKKLNPQANKANKMPNPTTQALDRSRSHRSSKITPARSARGRYTSVTKDVAKEAKGESIPANTIADNRSPLSKVGIS